MKKALFLVSLIALLLISGCVLAPKEDKSLIYCLRASEEECFEFCESLSEEECFKSEECIGEYGPSYCEGRRCTTDLVFKACIPSPVSPIEKTQLKINCEKTNGVWIEDKFGYGCNCQAGKTFDEKEGCV